MRSVDVISRILLATIFIVSGITKVMNFQAISAMSAGAGLPAPQAAIALAAAIEIVGGTALAIGWQTRWASLGLFLFLIPATVLFHALPMADPAQRQTQMIEVMKNLAILGGLLQVFIASARRRGFQDGALEEAPDYRFRRAS
jgi:putative oxidoreductase